MDFTRIKYYPDKFYICLDGFDLGNLESFADDSTFTQQQAIYLHEYYHYLTNLTTFFGARQFNCSFQDRVRIITRVLKTSGLGAFPLSANKILDSKYDMCYWKGLLDLFDLDDIDLDFATKVESTANKDFRIVRYSREKWPLSMIYNGETVRGGHIYYRIEVGDVTGAQFFNLSDGMIDEFLSSSIDEFLFEHNLAKDCDVLPILQSRPAYPYRTLDKLLSFFGADRVEAKCKILLSYFALHSRNPIEGLMDVLKRLKKEGPDEFFANPEVFLLKCMKGDEVNAYKWILQYEYTYIKECLDHGRKNLADTMTLIYDKQYKALEMLEQDFFCFVRPFMVDDIDNETGRANLLRLFKIIRKEMDEPVIVKDKKMIQADADTYKNHLAMHIAIYEIMDSLWNNQLARRLSLRKGKYAYPVESANTDDIASFPEVPPYTETWHVALNELGLYGVYLDARRKGQI